MTRLFGLDVQTSEVLIPLGDSELQGHLSVPDGAQSVIVLAEGNGSGLINAADSFLTQEALHVGFAALQVDLYTRKELGEDSHCGYLRFAVKRLNERLSGTVDWLFHQSATQHMAVGLMGSSTGAAAALMTAAGRPETIGAVVCRGGRPDLAGDLLQFVHAPTLLIVGENDHLVADLNREVLDRLPLKRQMIVVPGAGHQFEETGALEQVAAAANQWFFDHLIPNRAA
jgi:dienelactone hydrolase